MDEINNLDLNLCTTFLAVAKLGSITKAANALYVSQPAVSYNIKELENKLNCKLFNRTSKGVELTADAVKLLYYIESAYNTLRTGFKILNDSNDLLTGEVKIGVPTHICIYLVSDIIETFRKKYPGIRFSIVNKSTADMVELLEKRELDIIIDSYPVESSREDVTITDLLEVDNCFVGSNKYSNLLKNNKKISINELSSYPLILQPKTTSTRKELLKVMGENINKFEPNIEVATTEVMLDLVKKGIGIGYFSRMSVIDKIQSGELIEIPIEGEFPKTKICVAYISEFLTSAPKKFIEVLKEKTDMLSYLKQKTIRLILNQECTYNCKFCHKEGIKDNREELLNYEDIKYMFKIFNKKYELKEVHLTGGEPLLRKDLKEIITSLKNEGAKVKITTNGYLLKDNMWIGEYVDELILSIHSIDKKEYEKISGVKGAYEKVLEAIRELRYKYPTLKILINTVLIKGVNDKLEDISELVKFAISIKSDLKFIELYPNTIENYYSIDNIIPKITHMGYKKKKGNFRKNTYVKENHNIHLQRCTCSQVALGTDKNISCKNNNDIFISQDGKVNLCRNTDECIDLYNNIKNREDEELGKKIKEVYYKMGENCKC
ncbi:MAG: radical SAM protein [Clostridiales bacterium]|nr:radical SAM protein [Clostridiales bacterium]